ncbi:response regulator transcription factor [Paenibacillus sp. sgz302251]|uniref:response regulator transcription factor n=1 Tax=Paenibacillus sp. sgz302251 TaxID=3414493 RepID=UPI003C7B0C1C
MYNLFLADDEKLVVETLQCIINWEEHNIRLSGTATNGKAAFDQIMNSDIHIAIVDIRMPGMSGLELIERVKEQKPKVIFIVCSGYSDFSYAREAMKHGTVYYLTKPVEIDELLDAVKIATAKVDELNRHSDADVNRLKSEKMIAEALLYGQYYEECNYEQFFVATANIEELPDCLNVLDSMITDVMAAERSIHRLYNQDEIIMLFAGLEFNTVSHILLHITQEIKDKLNIDIQWGIGGNKPYADNIHLSYIQSKEAGNHAVFVGERMSTIYDVIYTKNEKLDISYPPLIEALTAPDGREQTKVFMDDFIERALANKIGPDLLIYHCTEIINYVSNYFKQLYSVPPEELYQHNYACIKQLNHVKSARSMGNATYDCLENMVDFLNDRMKDYKDKIISQIKEYVNDNIHKSISAADIAKVINFNPSYISNFFKKKTGVTLSDYITEIKIEKAKTLLSGSVLKINKIAEEVGYDDQRYFCLVFKKHSGITPSQFRDRKKPEIS